MQDDEESKVKCERNVKPDPNDHAGLIQISNILGPAYSNAQTIWVLG